MKNPNRNLIQAAVKAANLLHYYHSAQQSGQIIGTHPGALPEETLEVFAELASAIAKSSPEQE